MVNKKKKFLVYFELLSLWVFEEAQSYVKWAVTRNIYIYGLLQYRITTNFTGCSKCTLIMTNLLLCCKKNVHKDTIIIIVSNLSNDRSKASSKTIPPHSAI